MTDEKINHTRKHAEHLTGKVVKSISELLEYLDRDENEVALSQGGSSGMYHWKIKQAISDFTGLKKSFGRNIEEIRAEREESRRKYEGRRPPRYGND